MAIPSENILSASDSRILNTIFDPEAAPTTQTVTIDPTLPPDPHIPSPLLPALQATEARAIRAIESCQASSAGGGEEAAGEAERKRDEAYAAALAALTALISAHPAYASARNNRAQLRRWRFGDARLAGEPARAADAAAVLADLDAALALATPAAAAARGQGGREGPVRVGARQAAVLRGAWAQRGAVMLAAARRARRRGRRGRPEEEGEGSPVSEEEGCCWAGWDAGRLEEEASRSFFEAGRFGCAASRALAVRTNPYARLCGAIVGEALRREGVEGPLV
jgi:hypothetical protein